LTAEVKPPVASAMSVDPALSASILNADRLGRTQAADAGRTWTSSKKIRRQRPSSGEGAIGTLEVGPSAVPAASFGGIAGGRTTIGSKLAISWTRPFSSISKSPARRPVTGPFRSSATASTRTISTPAGNVGGGWAVGRSSSVGALTHSIANAAAARQTARITTSARFPPSVRP
jgi:hypothetical protein